MDEDTAGKGAKVQPTQVNPEGLRTLNSDDYRWCFGCGPDNPIGLHLRFHATADGVAAHFVSRPEHQGWTGIVHGGIVATLLDEALGYAAYFKVGPAVTGALDVRLRRPCPVGRGLTVEGRIVSERHGLLLGEARLVDEDGQVIADARGKFLRVSEQSGLAAAGRQVYTARGARN